jgi:hypothetical protein
MECRRLRNLQHKIALLGPHEHGVLLTLITDNGVKCDRNYNGYFCDLSAMDEVLVQKISDFVDFSIKNNEALEKYDRDVHDQVQLLQRTPPLESATAVHAVKKNSEHKAPAEPTCCSTTSSASKTVKMAFIKRANDVPRKKTPETFLAFEAPVMLYGDL